MTKLGKGVIRDRTIFMGSAIGLTSILAILGLLEITENLDKRASCKSCTLSSFRMDIESKPIKVSVPYRRTATTPIITTFFREKRILICGIIVMITRKDNTIGTCLLMVNIITNISNVNNI